MSKRLLSAFLISILITSSASALKVSTKALSSNKALFGIVFEGEQELSFYGKAGAVNSVSLQKYETGTYEVTEMVVDMTGSPLQLRIYFTELITLSSLQARLPDSTPNINSKPPAQVQKLIDQGRGVAKNAKGEAVRKEYPVATHSKTIEYNVGKKEELLDLYEAFSKLYIKRPIDVETGEANGQTTKEKVVRLGGTLFKVDTSK